MYQQLFFKNILSCLFIFSALSLSAAASAHDEHAPRIVVAGEGSMAIAPDMAVLNMTVTREAATAREALSANSKAMKKVLAAMMAEGIAKRDLQTANFSIHPKYSRPPRQGNGASEAARIIAYTVRNGLTVRVRELDKVGEVLDQAVTLGVNEGGNILFTNSDASDAIKRARVKAVQQARQKAATLAAAADVKVGRVLEITEQSHNPRPMPMARAEMSLAASADAVPIAGGENTYQVSVNVTFEIQ